MFSKYWNALKRSYRVIRFEINCYRCCIKGEMRVKFRFNKNAINKLEIGIGSARKKPNFVTSDINMSTDYPYDLRLGLPFPDASIDFIYAEHVLEHFDYSDLVRLIKDCYRVLKPEGIFSVVVPDAAIYIKSYHDDKEFDYNQYCKHETGLSFKTKIDYLNYIFYMAGHHRHMFDKENLLVVLSEAGFGKVRLRNFNADIDQRNRQFESIYAECVRE